MPRTFASADLEITHPSLFDKTITGFFIKERDLQFLSSGSRSLKDKILLDPNSDIFIWGIVTYVIHALH